MTLSLDPGRHQELTLRVQEVDRLYLVLSQQHHQLKHSHDQLHLELTQLKQRHKRLEDESGQLRNQLQEEQSENSMLRHIADQHLLKISALQSQIAIFLNGLPSQMPRNLRDLSNWLNRPVENLRIQNKISQDRLRNTERKLVKISKEDEKKAETEQRLRKEMDQQLKMIQSLKTRIAQLQSQVVSLQYKNQPGQSSREQLDFQTDRLVVDFLKSQLLRIQAKLLMGFELAQPIINHCELLESAGLLQKQLEQLEFNYRVRLQTQKQGLPQLKKQLLETRAHLNTLKLQISTSEQCLVSKFSMAEEELNTNRSALNKLLRKQKLLTSPLVTLEAEERPEELQSRCKQMLLRTKLDLRRSVIERDRQKLNKVCQDARTRGVRTSRLRE